MGVVCNKVFMESLPYLKVGKYLVGFHVSESPKGQVKIFTKDLGQSVKDERSDSCHSGWQMNSGWAHFGSRVNKSVEWVKEEK